MCGICGTAGFADEGLMRRMTDVIAHRGPDDYGVFVSPGRRVGLGNRRLSIIDLSSAGHMPMANEDKSLWITHNGEIYNFPELRQRLMQRGYRFRSGTDTETILRLYEDQGVEAFKQLNGIFAFALWDERQQALYLVRDRMGVKPLYYAVAGPGLVFGSEVKSLLLAPGMRAEPDLEAIHCAVTFRWLPTPLTGFKNIYKLPPGHWLRWQDNQTEVHCYWDIPYADSARADSRPAKSTAAWVAEFRDTFFAAVKRQQISDVPVGVFLSGGLDSSAIAAAMAAGGQRLRAYTIAFRDQDQSLEQMPDETGYARQVAEHLGSEHQVIVVEPNMVDVLPKLVWHMDEPVADPAAISTYMICRTARPDVTVLLSGQGGDEMLAGYRLYGSHRLANYYAAVPSVMRRWLTTMVDALPRLRRTVPGISPGLILAAHRYLSNLTRYGALPMAPRHVAYHSNFSRAEKQALLTPDFQAALNGRDDVEYHMRYFDKVNHPDQLNHYLYVDQKTFLPELNLTYADKMGMAASAEIRVPFLDNELMDLMACLPADLKLRGLTGKYVLREAMHGLLPPDILTRRKGAFGAPIRSWLQRDLRPMVDELLSDSALFKRNYFNPAAVQQIRRRAEQGLGNSAHQLWILLTLEVWHQVFIDQPAGGSAH